MYFNQTYGNENVLPFDLTVWNDVSNKPGKIIFRKTQMVPAFEDSLNQYHTYSFDDTTIVIDAGNFYVGWIQGKGVMLNVGFDRNFNEQQNLLANGKTSFYQGALMIRPVFGKKIPVVQAIHELDQQKISFRIYPNPSTDGLLQVDISNIDNNEQRIFIEIFDLPGNKIFSSAFTKTIDVSSLTN